MHKAITFCIFLLVSCITSTLASSAPVSDVTPLNYSMIYALHKTNYPTRNLATTYRDIMPAPISLYYCTGVSSQDVSKNYLSYSINYPSFDFGSYFERVQNTLVNIATSCYISFPESLCKSLITPLSQYYGNLTDSASEIIDSAIAYANITNVIAIESLSNFCQQGKYYATESLVEEYKSKQEHFLTSFNTLRSESKARIDLLENTINSITSSSTSRDKSLTGTIIFSDILEFATALVAAQKVKFDGKAYKTVSFYSAFAVLQDLYVFFTKTNPQNTYDPILDFDEFNGSIYVQNITSSDSATNFKLPNYEFRVTGYSNKTITFDTTEVINTARNNAREIHVYDTVYIVIFFVCIAALILYPLYCILRRRYRRKHPKVKIPIEDDDVIAVEANEDDESRIHSEILH